MEFFTMQQDTPQYRGARHAEHDGFSLLELVVAVSIMLILGVVGTVSYQAYTDNARQAALETSASDVLTAVVAEDSVPNGDVHKTLEEFNQSSGGIMVDITSAQRNGVTVQAMTCDGKTHALTLAGNYDHLDTTNFSGVQYEWVSTPHRSASTKTICGEVVARNEASDPTAKRFGWHSNDPNAHSTRRVTLDDHPLGITTGVETHVQDGVSRNSSLSLYDAGALPRSDREFYAGVWVKTDTPGYAYIRSRDFAVDLEPNEWTFITTGNEKTGWNESYGESIAGVTIRHASTDIAGQATSWATGFIASYDTPVEAYFDGDM